MRQILIPACQTRRSADGRYSVELPPGAREQFQTFMGYCFEKHNGFWSLKGTAPRKRRSLGPKSQNKHINGHIQQICSELGISFDETKLFVKSQAVDMGYPILEDEKGMPVRHPFFGWVMGISEADADVHEAKILIDAAHMVAAQHGIALIEEEVAA